MTNEMQRLSLDYAYAYGRPEQSAIFRQSAEDFYVDENLCVDFADQGEHFWLHIEKCDENTDWVAKKLANYFSIRTMDVGYSGKKDRRAVTRQWFSLYLPGREHQLDWQQFIEFSQLNARLLSCHSHTQKLRLGAHVSNHFRIRLRDVVKTESLTERLERIADRGVPNYFGEQRFGREAGNLRKAETWARDPRSIRDRRLRSLIISAARSQLFNRVLSHRVGLGQQWREALVGDIDSHIATGPLWGRGRSLVAEDCAQLEHTVLAEYGDWCAALEHAGLSQERRPLCLQPRSLSWNFADTVLELSFELGPGEFATSVLRELVTLRAHVDRAAHADVADD